VSLKNLRDSIKELKNISKSRASSHENNLVIPKSYLPLVENIEKKE